jgi:hypothetical protein
VKIKFTKAEAGTLDDLVDMSIIQSSSLTLDADENVQFFRKTRSKTMPTSSSTLMLGGKNANKESNNNSIAQSYQNLNLSVKNFNMDRFKMAKEEADKAIKVKREFEDIDLKEKCEF